MRTRPTRRQRRLRRGATAVLVAVSLVGVISVVALAIDAGMLFDTRRSVQAAADAAALSAADDLFNNYSKHMGLDPSGSGKASALSTAKSNGFSNDGVQSVVTVHIPPSSGIAAGKPGYAEVIVRANQQRGFSRIAGSGTLAVQCRAVACGSPGNVGVYILEPVKSDCLAIDGYMKILNDGVINVNSSATGAGQIANRAHLTCGGINVVGTLQNKGGVITYTGGGSLRQGAASVADPLANVPDPIPSGANHGNLTCSGTMTIQPGVYNHLIINKNARVTMAPGVYYLGTANSPGLGITIQTGGTLTGAGVMISNNSGDRLNFRQAGPINLSPPTSGPYRGIICFEPRASNLQIHIESRHNVTMTGTFYAQKGSFNLRPDGASTVFTIGTYVANNIEACQGDNQKSLSNGQIIINPADGAPTRRPSVVE